jgi:hypothetical protein
VGGDDLVAPQEQDDEERRKLPGAYRDRTAILLQLERTEELVPQRLHFCHPAAVLPLFWPI